MRAFGRWHAEEERADHDSAPGGAPDIRSAWAFQPCALGIYGVVLWLRSGTGDANPAAGLLLWMRPRAEANQPAELAPPTSE